MVDVQDILYTLTPHKHTICPIEIIILRCAFRCESFEIKYSNFNGIEVSCSSHLKYSQVRKLDKVFENYIENKIYMRYY